MKFKIRVCTIKNVIVYFFKKFYFITGLLSQIHANAVWKQLFYHENSAKPKIAFN